MENQVEEQIEENAEQEKPRKKNRGLVIMELALGIAIILLALGEVFYLMDGKEISKPEKAVLEQEDAKRINRAKIAAQRVKGITMDGADIIIGEE